MQAEVYETLGNSYRNLGEFWRADSLLDSALKLRRRTFGDDSAPVAKTLVALGKLRKDQGKVTEAERLVRQGINLESRQVHQDETSIGQAESALGEILELRRQFSLATGVLEQAEAIHPLVHMMGSVWRTP